MLPTRDPAFHYAPPRPTRNDDDEEFDDDEHSESLSSLQMRSIAKLYENLGGMEALSGFAPSKKKKKNNNNGNGSNTKTKTSSQKRGDKSASEQQQSGGGCSSSAASSTNSDDDTSSSAGRCSSSGSSTDLCSDDDLEHKKKKQHLQKRDNDVTSMMMSAAAGGGGRSGTAGNNSNTGDLPVLARGFSSTPPLPWSVFQRLRRSNSKGGASPQELTSTQEANVLRALAKIRSGTGSIHDSVPVVSAVVDKLCPDLPPHPPSAPGPRDGATFTLLAVITGHADLLRACLELGGNANDQRFLMDHSRRRPGSSSLNGACGDDDRDCGCGSVQNNDKSAAAALSSSSSSCVPQQLCHGYSPFFVACLCEQLECMEVLKEYGASLHVADRWGRTPLHAAASLHSKVVLDWLLAQGAPRSVADRDGFRPGEAWWAGCSYPSATTSALAEVLSSSPPSPQQQQQQRSPPQQQDQQQEGESATVWQKLGADGKSSSNKNAAPVDTAVVPLPVPARDPASPHPLFRASAEQQQQQQRAPCPCSSGRLAGACGCVDDMHERWYLDRAGARWLSGDITAAVAEAQSSVLALAFPQFVGMQQQSQQQ